MFMTGAAPLFPLFPPQYEVERMRRSVVIATPMTLDGDTKERRNPLNRKNERDAHSMRAIIFHMV